MIIQSSEQVVVHGEKFGAVTVEPASEWQVSEFCIFVHKKKQGGRRKKMKQKTELSEKKKKEN